MTMNLNHMRLAAVAAASLFAGAAFAAEPPTGIWIDHTGRGAVEIKDCGAKLCGHVYWLQNKGHGQVCGMQVIGNVKPAAGGTWDGGWIYDPDEESRYNVELTPLGPEKLKVLGYAGSKFLSETMIWKRAPADLKRCGT